MTEVSILIQHHAGPTGDVLVIKNADGTYAFPTGKIHCNESEADAAKRVAWEVLGIDTIVGKMAMIGHKKPNDGIVEHLREGNIKHDTNTYCDYHVYYEAVDRWQTEPTTGIEFAWVHASELGTLAFAGDDANFMAKYDKYVNPAFIPDVRMY